MAILLIASLPIVLQGLAVAMSMRRVHVSCALSLVLYACSSQSLQGGSDEQTIGTSEPDPTINTPGTSAPSESPAPNASSTSTSEQVPVGTIAPPATATASGTSGPAEPPATGTAEP